MAEEKQSEEKELTLEENFERLEKTIGRLEDDGISLEDACAA